jgi:L-threonylcarbamoyladenylate synthase
VTAVPDVVEAIKAGKLAVIPTDTVYGIAALVESREAIDAVFAVKGRARGKGLPILAAGRADLTDIGVFDANADVLAEKFWPGPLTLVLPRSEGFQADLGGEQSSVALRVPNHDVALEILRDTGALAVTSANISGAWAATSVAEARAAVGHVIDVFLDGGRCDGSASTIVSLLGDEPEVLRKGPISEQDILTALGKEGPKERVNLF